METKVQPSTQRTARPLVIVDDVVNTGFTKERVESTAYSLNPTKETLPPLKFSAQVLNRQNLSNPRLVNSNDFFAVEVNAANDECDWGTITCPLGPANKGST